MKLFFTGLGIIAAFVIFSLLSGDKVSSSAKGIGITATLLGVNFAMLWGVVRKHR